jgi:DNA sulfur modification protein DndD
VVARWRADLSETDSRLSRIEPEALEQRREELSGVIRSLRKLAPAGVVSAIRRLEQQLEKAVVDDHRLKQDSRLIEERLKGQDPEAILRFQAARDRCNQMIGRYRETLAGVLEELKATSAALRDAYSRVDEGNDPQIRALQADLDTLQRLGLVVEDALHRFVHELRKQVESEASNIFCELTTDKSYRGLAINDRYGLTIIDRTGNPVTVRSAGAEQIVAVSLIGALNRLAVKRGPLIMDTPFGRLDQKHRDNILRFLPELGEQALLLVHDGEVDPVRDLAVLRPKIAREYRIERTSTGDSVIQPGGIAA